MSAHRPRKRFGQHFLTDPGIIEAIVRSIAPTQADVVVEIGPGKGAITTPLLARAGTLHAIELDRDLAASLRARYADKANLHLHEADALRFDYSSLGESLRIVGNLPYNISTPLLFHLLAYRERILDMHFMLQKEVVDRSAFDPPPAVTSAIVRLLPLPAGTYDIHNEARLSQLVATAFSQRRKTIRNSLRQVVDEARLRSVGIDPGLRPEAVSIAEYVQLANTLE
jgi:16S rRNA (adenine1518-N6/adenine1519-N6)-dimethyltransferase